MVAWKVSDQIIKLQGPEMPEYPYLENFKKIVSLETKLRESVKWL